MAGATAAVRTLDEVDYRRRIGCRVTATGAGGRRAIATSTSRIVALGSFGLVLRPVVFGQVRRGSRLVADRGRWSTTPATYTYQWRRGGVAIRGATAASYTLKRADVRRGVVVSVVVTVRRRAYAPAAAASLVVVGNRPGIVASTRGPIILRASRGTWSPAPTSFVYQWYRDGRVITGANAPAYRVTRSDRGRGLTVVVTVRRGRAVLGSAASVVTRIPRA